eukprot:COSAG02_NODE_8114_length_2704_cov_1.761228_3_plen_64_part_00
MARPRTALARRWGCCHGVSGSVDGAGKTEDGAGKTAMAAATPIVKRWCAMRPELLSAVMGGMC